MAWAFALLTFLVMVAGAIWLWNNNRTDKTDSPIGPAGDTTTAAEEVKIQALVSLTSESPKGSTKKARSKKAPKAHSAANCPLCLAEGLGSGGNCGHRELREYDDGTQRKLVPYWMLKSSQGRPKRSNTEGYCCKNPECYYQKSCDSTIHALVYDGERSLKTGDAVRLFKCQHCTAKFCARRDTVMYGLKAPTQDVKRSMAALAEGLSVSATARVFERGRGTIQRWSDRSAAHMSKLHDLMFRGIQAVKVELDELRTRIKGQADATWVWVAFEAKSKLRLATQVGRRTQDNAHILIHQMKQTLAAGCAPVFSSDGLMLYYGGLTGHYGHWEPVSEEEIKPQTSTRKRKKKPVWRWVVDTSLLYGQMTKRYIRRKLRQVKREVVIGDAVEYVRRLIVVGFTGLITTAFVERHNLQMRQSVSPLIRRTWSLVCSEQALERRLELQRGIYHFAKPHGGLRVKLDAPIAREGRRIPKQYLQQTPAIAAGLTNHIWSLEEILLFPIHSSPDQLALPPT